MSRPSPKPCLGPSPRHVLSAKPAPRQHRPPRRPPVHEIELTPAQLRRLQLVQLEMLTELDRICKKCGIAYSIDGGTLLGAVRHRGFIPWDDDVDVIMLRSEYERFFAACQTELDGERFFLQERRTDPHYRVGYTRLRRKGTTYVRAGHEGMHYHTGVLIDLFVLDNVPDNPLLRVIHRGLCFFFRKLLWSASGRIVSKIALLRGVYAALSLVPPRFVFWGLAAMAGACNRRPTRLVSHYTMPYPNPKKNLFGMPAELMESFTELAFEGQKFSAVADYRRYLTLLYGDYMTPPPEEDRRAKIHLSAFDAGAAAEGGEGQGKREEDA